MKYWDAAQQYIEKNKEQAFAINFELAAHPEVSGQEVKSSAFIRKTLEEAGIAVEAELCGVKNSFKGTVVKGEGANRPRLAILAEYDALPDIGHACGHCASGSISVLSALTLKSLHEALLAEGKGGLPMDVDIIGTPDEEATGGKVDLVNAGAFNGYDFAIMVHMDGVESRPNSAFLALDCYRVSFKGVPAHAAGEPWNGVNALNSMNLAFNAIDMLRQQTRPETRIGYYVINGGNASNVIPEYTEFEICVRHTERDYLNTLVEKVRNCVKGAAIATGTTYEMNMYGNSFDDMKWNETGTDLISQVYDELGLPHKTGKPTDLGSSDIGNVSKVCPAFHPTLRLKGDDKVAHTIGFAKAMNKPTIKTSIVEGASIITKTLLHLMEDPAKLEAIKKEFNEA